MKPVRQHIGFLWVLLIILPSCQQEDCSSAAVCKPCVQCETMRGSIHLSQLDEVSRERLKSEVLAELKAEMQESWRREFEKANAQNRPTDPPKIVQEVPEKKVSDSKPDQKQAKLPPTQEIGRDSGGMKILRQVFTTQVSHRLPIDERESFSVEDATVICFVEISSASELDRAITIRFTHSTGLTQSYSLPVGQSPAWRTWSKLNLTRSMTGTWLCEVFNEEETLLASKAFVVVE